MILSIDLDKIAQLSAKADEILLTADGEKHLKELLELKNMVDEAIADAKIRLREAALSLNPNFSSITGDSVKVSYRPYGARFSVDPTKVDQLPKDMYTTTVKYAPVVDKVEDFINEKGAPPVGIVENNRQPQITLKLREAASDEE